MDRIKRTIEMSTEAWAVMDSVLELEGMKQKEAVSRIIECWAALSRPARQLMIGTLPTEYSEDATKRAAAEIGDFCRDREAKASPAQDERASPRFGGERSGSTILDPSSDSDSDK